MPTAAEDIRAARTAAVGCRRLCLEAISGMSHRINATLESDSDELQTCPLLTCKHSYRGQVNANMFTARPAEP